MDCVFGITGKDFVLVCADRTQARSVITYKRDEEKIFNLDSHKVLGCAGEHADRTNFSEYIQKNLALQSFSSGMTQSCHSTANYIRGQLAYFLRKSPYQVNMIMGGVDLKKENPGTAEETVTPVPSIYYIDYMASMQKADFGAHGYGSFFIYSTLDRYWKAGLTVDEAKDIARKCIAEINLRFMMALPNWSIQIVDAEGVRQDTLGDAEL